MVNYTCFTCNKSFNRKSNYDYHTNNKKKPCKQNNNFMFTEKTRDLNNLIMLDFSIIKTKTKTKYDIENKYFIWPNINNTLIEIIPSYSTCINGLELLFGYDQIIKLPNNELINIYLKIIEKKNKNIYDIFYNGLILRINTDNFKKLLNAYVS